MSGTSILDSFCKDLGLSQQGKVNLGKTDVVDLISLYAGLSVLYKNPQQSIQNNIPHQGRIINIKKMLENGKVAEVRQFLESSLGGSLEPTATQPVGRSHNNDPFIKPSR